MRWFGPDPRLLPDRTGLPIPRSARGPRCASTARTSRSTPRADASSVAPHRCDAHRRHPRPPPASLVRRDDVVVGGGSQPATKPSRSSRRIRWSSSSLVGLACRPSHAPGLSPAVTALRSSRSESALTRRIRFGAVARGLQGISSPCCFRFWASGGGAQAPLGVGVQLILYRNNMMLYYLYRNNIMLQN